MKKVQIEVYRAYAMEGEDIGEVAKKPILHRSLRTRPITAGRTPPGFSMSLANSQRPSKRAIVSLGSNIEPRTDYLTRAIAALSSLPETTFVKASSVIETEPIDVPFEFVALKFLNQVAVFDTKLDVFDFSRRMHAIENTLGRVRTVRNGPRTIDIDLIDFGGQVINTPELTLPHPRARDRVFVLRPLKELGIKF